MFTKRWARVALVCAGVAGVGLFALTSRGHEKLVPAPSEPVPAPPREKPTDEAWLPKPGSDPKAGKSKPKNPAPNAPFTIEPPKDLAPDPPSAFPDLREPDFPVGDPNAREKRLAAFESLCSRLFGTIALKIVPTDDTLRKLLKARLHQATLEFQDLHRQQRGAIQGPPHDPSRYRNCLSDIEATARELWAGQPKELVLWLEELVIASKEFERLTRLRVGAGSAYLSDLHAITKLRLKMEAELWKAKNAK
jgi:hypothetical protein